jgi:hypothetical protein
MTDMTDFVRPEGFTGYRAELENRDAIRAGSSPYELLVGGSEQWQEGELLSWWHVRNQGNKGSCRGHSLAANARLSYVLQVGAGHIDLDGDGQPNEANFQDDFSPDYCYYQAQKQSNIHGDNGATVHGGIAVGMTQGILPEKDLPYNEAYNPSRITQGMLETAKNFRFGRYTELTDAEKAFDWVGSGQGGLDWGTVWPLPFVKGCLVKGMSSFQTGGGHATAGGTLIRGATLIKFLPQMASEVKPDEWVMQFMNSHSEHAQFRGFYFVTMAGLHDVLSHRATTAIGWSDMAVPKPRKFDFNKFSVFG